MTQARLTIIALAQQNTEQATKIEHKLIRVQSSIDQEQLGTGRERQEGNHFRSISAI